MANELCDPTENVDTKAYLPRGISSISFNIFSSEGKGPAKPTARNCPCRVAKSNYRFDHSVQNAKE